MDTTIPGDIDKADEIAPVPRADPAQAVPAQLVPPVLAQDLVTETLGMQRVDRGVVDIAAPLVGDHMPTVGKARTGAASHCARASGTAPHKAQNRALAVA